MEEKQRILKDLMSLRNIGPKMAERLYQIGIRSSCEVKQHQPEKLYERLNEILGYREDRCVLYIFRGARDDLPWWVCSDKNQIGGDGDGRKKM